MRLKLSLGRHREPQLIRRLPPEREHTRFDVDPGDTRMSFIFFDGEHEQKIVHGGKWKEH